MYAFFAAAVHRINLHKSALYIKSAGVFILGVYNQLAFSAA
jgi:hypothetical protein